MFTEPNGMTPALERVLGTELARSLTNAALAERLDILARSASEFGVIMRQAYLSEAASRLRGRAS